MSDTVIVGGGIHGTLLQLAVFRQEGTLPTVVDPESEPLSAWKRNCAACGMRFLRSSSSHNLELDFHALRRFARERGYDKNHFISPYMRPSLELFNAHADYLVEKYGLSDRSRDKIVEIRSENEGFFLRGVEAGYRARRVILAPGPPPPAVPWTEERLDAPERACHVFDPRFSLEQVAGTESVAIVGCGVTGGQLALALAGREVGHITIFDMSEPSQSDYDGNPCFVGPKCAPEFDTLRDATERRKAITLHRYPGTLPRDIYAELDSVMDSGTVAFEQGRVKHLRQAGEKIEVEVSDQERSIRRFSFDRVVAATGFAPRPPADTLITRLAKAHALPRGPHGYPYPDESLQWPAGLYVAGALAELRIGPPARNIIGAHLAARRILPTL